MVVLLLSALLLQPPEPAPSYAPLERVPFPLETKGDSEVPPREQAVPIVDLRDPFAVQNRRVPRGRGLVRLGLPDLKDPFSGRRSAPRGWSVTLPGDIRDPFSPKLKHRYLGPRCVDGKPARTVDGVAIQRPGTPTTAPTKAKGTHGCRRAPFDLRDPFAAT